MRTRRQLIHQQPSIFQHEHLDHQQTHDLKLLSDLQSQIGRLSKDSRGQRSRNRRPVKDLLFMAVQRRWIYHRFAVRTPCHQHRNLILQRQRTFHDARTRSKLLPQIIAGSRSIGGLQTDLAAAIVSARR